MKSNACITVEFLAGTAIEEAIAEGRRLAVLLNIAYVKFDFNGIEVNVRATGDDARLLDDCCWASRNNRKYVIG